MLNTLTPVPTLGCKASGKKGLLYLLPSSLGLNTTLLLLKAPPSVVRVVLTLAMLSAITSSLVLCAVKPLPDVLIIENIPIYSLLKMTNNI